MPRQRDKYLKRKASEAYWKAKNVYNRTPRGRYFAQRYKAWKRRIPWHYNFDSWWAKWQESGKWELRGSGVGKYCMCRHGDQGPYSVDNTFIGLHLKNFSDGRYSPRRKRKHK